MIIKHLTVLIAFLMMIVSQVSAVDPDDKQKLEDTKQCAQCNLEGAKMKGAILCNTIMPDGSVIYSEC